MPQADAAAQNVGALATAASLGRLDEVVTILAAIAILLAIGGVFAFFDVRRVARIQAREVAKEEGRKVAEAAAVSYLESELPKLISEYQELAKNAVAAADADAIAKAQE